MTWTKAATVSKLRVDVLMFLAVRAHVSLSSSKLTLNCKCLLVRFYVERVIQSDDEIVTFHVKESFKQIMYGHQPFVLYILVTNYGDFCVIGSA